MNKLIARITGTGISLTLISQLAKNALAQTASTASASKGGTSSSLPEAGTTELTYLIFGFGVMLFVFGMMKLVKSFR